MYDVLVLGSDKRSHELCKILKKQNMNITYYEFNKLLLDDISKTEYDVIFMPVPTKSDDYGYLLPYNGLKLHDIISANPNSYYIYATIDKSKVYIDSDYAINLLDDEKFLIKNAYLTARAAYEIIFEETTAKDKVCLVCGMGRIGKYLCEFLYEHGAKILTATSKSEKYKDCIIIDDSFSYDMIKQNMPRCDFIFNTAPTNIFKLADLEKYSGRYIELASQPYGFKYNKLAMPECVRMCPSLPGKHYPKQAAQIIAECFLEHRYRKI